MSVDAKNHDHTNGAAGCPECSKHDHSDKRIIGRDHGVPVKAWELSCPKCGSLDIALTEWTQVGREVHAKLRNGVTA